MSVTPDPASGKTGPAPRRSSVRRTVLVLLVIVVAIYAAFILSGVMGQ